MAIQNRFIGKRLERLPSVLRPGGVLFVGSTEILPSAACAGLERLDMSFYQRVDQEGSSSSP